MSNGKAELKNVETGEVVATFSETRHHDGTAIASVKLRTPITLQGTELLQIFALANSTLVISVGASDPAGTTIREFHGKSAIGYIPDGTEATLVKIPGGSLGTLLVVLGKGQITRSH
jgi:hypothetical protein